LGYSGIEGERRGRERERENEGAERKTMKDLINMNE
jgi:hypothetical protein